MIDSEAPFAAVAHGSCWVDLETGDRFTIVSVHEDAHGIALRLTYDDGIDVLFHASRRITPETLGIAPAQANYHRPTQ